MAMDPTSFRQLTTRRGINYSYFVSTGQSSSPTLLLLHGFPSTAYDWHLQVQFFAKEGYGIIAPDLLGSGKTDKPLDPLLYKQSEMSKDIIDILDAENVEKAIAIGHDWGCALVSRLANYFPERFIAFAFLAVGYMPPSVPFDYEAALAITKQILGYEAYGYWEFFVRDEEADQIIKDHWESFLTLSYPSDPTIWRTHLCPRGGIKAHLLSGDIAPSPSYLTETDKKAISTAILSGGLKGAFNWYRIMLDGITDSDDKQISESRQTITQPVFFGAANRDYVCVPALALARMKEFCPDLTVKEFDLGHWVQLEAPEEVNRELAAWIQGVTKAKL
ncbi:epoxide hydrolase [Laetiporus sulphureus 93-53]|uniref:Epoxide hydrolase n=1 Tax=Laetiporus sulphureus 93-53 TaxID=1314785 RepID=A0A165B456_9APHY|nr:epoxide hydrolase [Laetiporus sulphureus 93-53]KZT00187.1 epoxide hydrolase [Laetiporus sulphureus 93-53]